MDPVHRAVLQGLLLPLRVYFQPQRLADEEMEPYIAGNAKLYWLLIYLFAMAWIPAVVVLTMLILGSPAKNAFGLPGYYGWFLLVPGLFALPVAVARGFGYMPGALGVVFALMMFVGSMLEDKLPVWDTLAVARWVDRSAVDYVQATVFGGGIGVMMSMLCGHLFGVRKVVLFGLPIGLLLIASFVILSPPNRLGENLALSVTASLALTHLLWQPAYFAVGLVSALVARAKPAWSQWLWLISPANWFEFCYVPMPVLDLLKTVYRYDSLAGEHAARQVAAHPFLGVRVVSCVKG